MSGQANIELLVLAVLVAAIAIMAAVIGYYTPVKTSSSGLSDVAQAQSEKVSGTCYELARNWM
ncbi:hypothetical protein [Methanopyrus sp.]